MTKISGNDLDSPHSQTFQTLKAFTKQNFLKKYKLKLVKDFPAKPERSVQLVSNTCHV